MQNSRLMSLIRRVDMFLGTDAETTEIETRISTETAKINLRYSDSNSAWLKQIFDNESTRKQIAMNGDLRVFSNTAQVTLVLSDDAIMEMDSSNGHRLTFFQTSSTAGPMPKSHLLQHPDGYFTFMGGVLTYHDDATDISGKYEYQLKYIPPCPQANRNSDAPYRGDHGSGATH
jgi:hypothetical protein